MIIKKRSQNNSYTDRDMASKQICVVLTEVHSKKTQFQIEKQVQLKICEMFFYCFIGSES